MILDIPSKKEFFLAATNYLHSALFDVLSLCEDIIYIDENLIVGDIQAEKAKYLRSEQQALTSAAALIQQATEFYLKGTIIDVSPYLLIVNNPQNWPKKSANTNISFSEFRTVDAQDLIKIHNTVCSNRLDDTFIQKNQYFRLIRNKAMHSVDKTVTINVQELLEHICYIHTYFMPNISILNSLYEFYKHKSYNSPIFLEHEHQTEIDIIFDILAHFKTIINILSPAPLKTYFNYYKREKTLPCPTCFKNNIENNFIDHELLLSCCAFTYQKIGDSNQYKCCFCNYIGSFNSSTCEKCETKSIDNSTLYCVECGLTEGDSP